LNISDYEKVFGIVILQLVFYITSSYNSVIDSTFYGVGKTQLVLYQSLCIDVFYYGIAFILYTTGIFTPTLASILMLFGIGMALDFIPTLILYIKMLKDKKLKINQRVSIRYKIFREAISNLLIHREFSNPFPAKLIIEQNRVYIENSNKPHGNGLIDPENFSLYPKNPTIAKFFKETAG
jgi:hypothetical protein